MPNQEHLLVWFFLVAWDFIEWTVKNQALVKKNHNLLTLILSRRKF